MATSRLHPSGQLSDIGVVQLTSEIDEHKFLHLDASRLEHISLDTSSAAGNVIGNIVQWRNNWTARNNQMIFVQDIAAYQPELHSSAVNGLPAVWCPGFGQSPGPHLTCHGEQFPGSSKFHKISKSNSGATGSVSLPTGSGSDKFTGFCIVALTDATNPGSSGGVVFSENNQLCEINIRPWQDQIRYYGGRDVNKPMGNQGGDWYQHRYNNVTLWTSGTEAKRFHFTYDGTYPEAYFNGTLLPHSDSGTACDLYVPNFSVTYQSTIAGPHNDAMTLFGERMNASHDVTSGFRGYLCELIMFDDLLSATQIAEINVARAAKWGTP